MFVSPGLGLGLIAGNIVRTTGEVVIGDAERGGRCCRRPFAEQCAMVRGALQWRRRGTSDLSSQARSGSRGEVDPC
jgi:hypothetical protein